MSSRRPCAFGTADSFGEATLKADNANVRAAAWLITPVLHRRKVRKVDGGRKIDKPTDRKADGEREV